MTRIPLVLLPGLLLDERLFAAQIESLADVAEVTVGDLSRDERIEAQAASVLDAAPERFALAGLSMGGYVALEIMRAAPERVLRLALLDTQARADDDAARERRQRQIALVEGGGFNAVKDELLPGWVHPARRGDPALMARLHAMADAIGPEGFVREQRAIMSRPDSRPGLRAIGRPTLVLCGRQDTTTPMERHEEIAAAIADATLVVLPECAHLAPLERPGDLTAQLRIWLTG